MKRLAVFATFLLAISAAFAFLSSSTAQAPGKGKGKGGYQPTEDEKKLFQSKLDELNSIVSDLRTKDAKEDQIADVEVFAKAAQRLNDFPEDITSQAFLGTSQVIIDRGIERGKKLQNGQAEWLKGPGRRVLGYNSPLDGSVQPYLLQVPSSYDGTRAVPLYLWLHGRNNGLNEVSFINGFANAGPKGTSAAPDLGQIQLEVFGRGNNAYHWAGEADIFESIANVQKRFKIDPKRIVLRGFSLGGAGAWHLALHRPDFWAAAEIGAGTWPRRYLEASMFPDYQQPTLRIWENMPEWALNGFDLPLAGHSGDADNQTPTIPQQPAGTKNRGQLESSIKVREQLEKEGFKIDAEPNPSGGEALYMVAKGTPDIFLVSEKTGHGINAVTRKRLDAFLTQWTTKGQTSPDEIRFLTYTTRYNQCYWITIDGMQKHYERAEVDAKRTGGGTKLEITTKNVSRLLLREADKAQTIDVDGQKVSIVQGGATPETNGVVAVEKTGGGWKQADVKRPGLHKTHALQGPIDDAFLDPFLLVRPTGTPLNDAANKAALKTLAAFDKNWAKNYRSHPRVKDDKDVTEADLKNFNVILFGDPGSNKWIGQLQGKLPLQWTKETITFGGKSYPAAEHIPAMIYPNPLSPSHYVVINSGLTIAANEYNADYSMPRLGDFAILHLTADAEPTVARAGFFDESWQVPPGSTK